MKLANCELRPAQIIQVLENGSVKVDAKGLFSPQDSGDLPVIQPFFMGGNSSSYSSPELYEWVWVLNNTENPQQLYWFKKFEFPEVNSAYSDDVDVEVICNKEVGDGNVSLAYSGNGGWNIKTPYSNIQISQEGHINLNSGSFNVNINDSGIQLGGNEHQAAYGDKVMEALSQIKCGLDAIKKAAMLNQYTLMISNAINDLPERLDKIIPEVMSDSVSLK